MKQEEKLEIEAYIKAWVALHISTKSNCSLSYNKKRLFSLSTLLIGLSLYDFSIFMAKENACK